MSCFRALFHEIRNTGAAVRKTVSEPAGNSGETQESARPQTGPELSHLTQATSEATAAPKRVVQAIHQVEHVAKEGSEPTGDQGPGEKEFKLRDKTEVKSATSTLEASKVAEDQARQEDKNQKNSEG